MKLNKVNLNSQELNSLSVIYTLSCRQTKPKNNGIYLQENK